MKKVFALIAASMLALGAMAQVNTTSSTPAKAKTECCKAANGCSTGAKECKSNCANPACAHNAAEAKSCCKKDAAKAEAKACCKKDAAKAEAKACCKKDAKAEKKSCCKKDAKAEKKSCCKK